MSEFPIGFRYNAEFHKVYEFLYKFPDDGGFEEEPEIVKLEKGNIYDRIGSSEGRFMCPLINGIPQSYLQRAIPYYVPEKDTDITKNPSYHRYIVKKDFGEGDIEGIIAKTGKIASCFWKEPDDGGGIQIELSRPIEETKDLFDEVQI